MVTITIVDTINPITPPLAMETAIITNPINPYKNHSIVLITLITGIVYPFLFFLFLRYFFAVISSPHLRNGTGTTGWLLLTSVYFIYATTIVTICYSVTGIVVSFIQCAIHIKALDRFTLSLHNNRASLYFHTLPL